MSASIETVERMTHSPEETRKLGRRLAGFLQPGDLIALTGELGSGKTVFTKGICAGLDVNAPVTSPSFTLIQEYAGRMPVFHLDFYRLDSRGDIEDLDIDRYLDNDGVCIIEWAERGEGLLPEDRFSILFERVGTGDGFVPEDRRLRIRGPAGRGVEEL